MMLFAAHNSGPLFPNFCINTHCRGLHHGILSLRFPKPARLPLGRSGFSANAMPLGSLPSRQPCYPKHFSLTLNTAFPFALQLSHEFFCPFQFCSLSNCLIRNEENIILLEEIDLYRIQNSLKLWKWFLWPKPLSTIVQSKHIALIREPHGLYKQF